MAQFRLVPSSSSSTPVPRHRPDHGPDLIDLLNEDPLYTISRESFEKPKSRRSGTRNCKLMKTQSSELPKTQRSCITSTTCSELPIKTQRSCTTSSACSELPKTPGSGSKDSPKTQSSCGNSKQTDLLSFLNRSDIQEHSQHTPLSEPTNKKLSLRTSRTLFPLTPSKSNLR